MCQGFGQEHLIFRDFPKSEEEETEKNPENYASVAIFLFCFQVSKRFLSSIEKEKDKFWQPFPAPSVCFLFPFCFRSKA